MLTDPGGVDKVREFGSLVNPGSTEGVFVTLPLRAGSIPGLAEPQGSFGKTSDSLLTAGRGTC
jgi:hypothetical protein